MTVSLRRMSAGSGYQYLLRSVAAGDSSRALSTPLTRYYSEVGTPPGRWLGSGVRALGSGQLAAGMQVTEEQLALLIGMGRDPITGEQLGRAYPTYKRLTDRIDERVAALDPEMTQEDCAAETSRIEAEETAAGMRHAVAGFDLTFSVPKSVSVLWGVADAATQERIADAHHKAVADIIDFFEREVAATRAGISDSDGAVAQVSVAGVAAVAYDHFDSRAGDPQLHTHVVVSNKVLTVMDERWRSPTATRCSPPSRACQRTTTHCWPIVSAATSGSSGNSANGAPTAIRSGRSSASAMNSSPSSRAALARSSSRRRNSSEELGLRPGLHHCRAGGPQSRRIQRAHGVQFRTAPGLAHLIGQLARRREPELRVSYLKGHVETLKTHARTRRHRYGQVMLIGAYGRFWERDAVDWSKTRLLGRRGRTSKTMRVIDFRHARGVYVLYDDLGVYYAGLCIGNNGLGGRLKNHLNDEHGGAWTRFSWFSFDSPDVAGTPRKDGVRGVVSWDGIDGGETEQIVRDLEALLIAAMRPWANIRNPKFQDGDEWEQVAEKTAEVKLFDDFRHLIEP